MGGGPPEPPRPGIGVDIRNLIILLMIVAGIIGAVRQCHRTRTDEQPPSTSQGKTTSAPQEGTTSPQDGTTPAPQKGIPSTSQENTISAPQEGTTSPQERTTSVPQKGMPSTPQEKTTPPPQEKSLSQATSQSKRATSCRTAAERMDKNGVLPLDYSINCPYWQWWSHNPPPPRQAQPAPDPPRTHTPPVPDPPRTQVPPETEPPRIHVFPDPEPTRREKDALRAWRYRRDRDWCCCPF
jgi:hypothetical protein